MKQETSLIVSLAMNGNSTRIAGEFKVNGAMQLCVWNPTRGDGGSWSFVMGLTPAQADQWTVAAVGLQACA